VADNCANSAKYHAFAILRAFNYAFYHTFWTLRMLYVFFFFGKAFK